MASATLDTVSSPSSSVSGAGRRGSDSSPVLEVRDLTKSFGTMLAVDGLSFTVNPGEVLGFLGPNGAGKSTTVGMVLGLIRPTRGSVRVAGTEVLGNQHVVAENIGAIIENPAFYPYLSGRDNLKAHALAVGNVPEGRINTLLKLVQLEERANSAFKTYSLGMKQRLGIASTLLTNPALVILDEPTNGLDPAGQREIREIIPRLADEGHSVLLASHMLHEVEQVSDRVVIVRRGKLITEGRVDELLKQGGYVEVSVAPEELEVARVLLGGLPGIQRVAVEKDALVVTTELDLGKELNRALVAHGIYASAITPKRSSLESLFLELTEDTTV